ncbi:MAG: hypothetical protein ABR508_08615 [Candidatus Baltobacteraceae bacterium]
MIRRIFLGFTFAGLLIAAAACTSPGTRSQGFLPHGGRIAGDATPPPPDSGGGMPGK